LRGYFTYRIKKGIMAERQVHGFDFQKKMVKELDLIEEKNYTGAYDAFEKSGRPVKIKCIKHGSSIDLGDIKRNAEEQLDHLLIIGWWSGKKDNIIKIDFLDITANDWRKMFNIEIMKEMLEWIKNVSNDKEYDKKWKEEVLFYKEKYGNYLIKPRFKRDHKTQKRIQCAINNSDYYNYFIKEDFYGKKEN
jgi:hypothetical protein